jgi:hypothetical protein
VGSSLKISTAKRGSSSVTWLAKPMTRRPVARSTAARKVDPIACWKFSRSSRTAVALPCSIRYSSFGSSSLQDHDQRVIQQVRLGVLRAAAIGVVMDGEGVPRDRAGYGLLGRRDRLVWARVGIGRARLSSLAFLQDSLLSRNVVSRAITLCPWFARHFQWYSRSSGARLDLSTALPFGRFA